MSRFVLHTFQWKLSFVAVRALLAPTWTPKWISLARGSQVSPTASERCHEHEVTSGKSSQLSWTDTMADDRGQSSSLLLALWYNHWRLLAQRYLGVWVARVRLLYGPVCSVGGGAALKLEALTTLSDGTNEISMSQAPASLICEHTSPACELS